MASQIVHFGGSSLVYGHIRVDLDIGKYGKRAELAQWWLGEQVLQDSRAVMPLRTGSLHHRSHTEDGGRRVVFPGPYARYLYMGFVMVDSETGKGPRKIPVGPGGDYILRFRKGAKLVPTNRRLNYSREEATDHWFDEAKDRNLTSWKQGVARIITTGRL